MTAEEAFREWVKSASGCTFEVEEIPPAAFLAGFAAARAAMAEEAQERIDLATLVRRFIYRARPGGPEKSMEKLCEQAQDYLNRKGLQGSILRNEASHDT